MHENHRIFARGMEQQKKVRLTFYSRKQRRSLVRTCAPLHYSEGVGAGDDKDCYYFWDFNAKKGSNFLALAPSKIASMEPTDEPFRVEDLMSSIGHQ
jgi:hypothetical protein